MPNIKVCAQKITSGPSSRATPGAGGSRGVPSSVPHARERASTSGGGVGNPYCRLERDYKWTPRSWGRGVSFLCVLALPRVPSTVPSTPARNLPHASPAGSCMAGARSAAGARAEGPGAGGAGGSALLTNAAETLWQSSPQLLHLADLLGWLWLNEVAHLGDAGPRQLP